jgi:chaperonin GroES
MRRIKMKIKPLYDRVVIEAIEEQSKTASGIIIPDAAKDKPKTGKVIAAGSGNYNIRGDLIKLDVKVGDTVLFNKNSGSETKLDGKNYLIMKESEIIGIIEE